MQKTKHRKPQQQRTNGDDVVLLMVHEGRGVQARVEVEPEFGVKEARVRVVFGDYYQ